MTLSALRGLLAGFCCGADPVPQVRDLPEPGALESMVHRFWAVDSVQLGLCGQGFFIIWEFLSPIILGSRELT